ncbi:MAG: RNA polymerase sigma factor [Ktedonobacterales bacterium]
MAWQDVFPLNVSHIDAEEERELRLASQARLGAEWALTALVARYQPPVTRYLTRLTGDPATTRTLAEQIFVHMEKRLRGPHGGQHLRLWLLRACTEAGLDTLRHPHRSHATLRLDSPRMAGLLPERAGDLAAGKLRAGLGALANLTGSTSRQVRQLIWSAAPQTPAAAPKPAPTRTRDTSRANGTRKYAERRTPPLALEDDPAQQDPREALRYRMVRAVLAEIPYGDAQCLALHLIAGLNQAEVAIALGITHSATRRRIVQGLQLFAQRYEAAAASLGLSLEALAPDTPHATMPPIRERTAPAAPLAAAPPTEAALEDARVASVEDQPTVAWDTPPFMVTLGTTGTPAGAAPPKRPVETVESLPPSLAPVTIAAALAPDVSAGAHTDADTLTLEEYDDAALHFDQDTTLVIVETTAVVDAIPVIEVPLMDVAVSAAPDVAAADAATALALAAVDIPARPPEPAQIEDAATSSPSRTAHIVPVLTPLASSPSHTPSPPVRIVPVLTSAALPPLPPRAEPADADVPLPTPAAPTMRIVPVLTQAVFAAAESPDVKQSEGDSDTDGFAGTDTRFDAPRETVALATGAPDAAAAEIPS